MLVNNQFSSESDQRGVYVIDVDTGQVVHLEAPEESIGIPAELISGPEPALVSEASAVTVPLARKKPCA